jgi:hypothetical protein
MMKATLKAVVDDRGIVQASAKGQPFVQPLDLDLTLKFGSLVFWQHWVHIRENMLGETFVMEN